MVKGVISKVTLRVKEKCVKVDALFDTRAMKSFASLKFSDELGYEKYDEAKGVLLAVENAEVLMVGELIARVMIAGFELPLSHVFGVVEGLRHDLIIGMDIMEPYEIFVDVKEGKVGFKRYPPTLEII